MEMVNRMKESGRILKEMDMVNIISQMVVIMRVIGVREKNKELDKWFIPMVIYMKENG